MGIRTWLIHRLGGMVYDELPIHIQISWAQYLLDRQRDAHIHQMLVATPSGLHYVDKE